VRPVSRNVSWLNTELLSGAKRHNGIVQCRHAGIPNGFGCGVESAILANQRAGTAAATVWLAGRAGELSCRLNKQAECSGGYFAEASRSAWQKHESYARRALFRFPIALVFHSIQPALFDMRRELASFDHEEFAGTGFAEVWAVDFSDAYYSAGHPLRRADMFCFKPREWFGFHRIGTGDRKPYG
jgi:hypothetical protein